MSDLLSILNQGAQSLIAHRTAAAVTSNNLQNAGTPGYARQRADLVAVAPPDGIPGIGFIGRGVQVQGITQARDKFIEHQMPAAFANKARSNAEAEGLVTIGAFDPDSPSGIPNALGAFYGAVRDLAQKPGDTALRQSLVANAKNLSLAFNRTADEVEAARAGLDIKLDATLGQVNAAAANVARLNGQIATARAQKQGEPNDLLDARQKAIDELAGLVGATPVPDNAGNANIVLPGGVSLVNGLQAATLSSIADPANGGHLAIQIRPGASGGLSPLAAVQFGGTIGGVFDARDGALRRASEAVDQLAYDVATTVNGVHQGGYALDGSTGRDFFAAPTGVPGAAKVIAVDAAVTADPKLIAASGSAATVPGDNTNLNLMLATERAALSTGVSAAQTFARITSDFGSEAQRASVLSEQDAHLFEHLATARDGVSGVSIDEELVNLTKAQRAFEAVAKVITTANELLDTLMKLK